MMTTEKSPVTNDDRLKLFTSEQLKWLDKARKFADGVPLADVIRADAENSFRRDLFEAACKEGLGALPFPTTYGGSGGDYVGFCLVNEEFGKRCIPIMSSLGVHVLCQEPVYRFGNEAQKQKYLPPSSTGQYLAAFGLTEPNAGSDTAAIETNAVEQGNEYVLNGTKTFITSGASADYFIVMARLKDDNAIASFIVEKGFPGFSIGQKFDMLGMRGYATCEIVFSDCRVPKENMLGAKGEGRKVALSSLAKGRVTIAAQATGWAQGALDAAVKVLRQKNLTNAKDVEMQLGELACLVESARVLMYQAAYSVDRGQSDAVLAGMAKVQATDAAMKVSTDVLSLLGADGIKPELLIERIFRDAKAGQIYEGTNQIQRMLIARSLLK
ncbi:MAG TPA: acyl-CoA dehydrogenase family protein [Trichormus sp.]|jgi:butyryl-CoA dehydrogenase